MDATAEASPPSQSQNDFKTASQRKQVHFGGTESAPSSKERHPGALSATAGGSPGAASPTTKLTASGGSLHANELFSPGGPQGSQNSQGSWTIEAQRTSWMDLGDNGTPASSSAGYSESLSARKVDDLRARLEGLELALKEMEGKAVAHLDKHLQEKVLATAAKIVSKRFLNDQELDKKLQVQILQTAMKVVKRQNAAAQAAAAAEEANPTRRLEFEQQGAADSSTVPAADVQEAVNTALVAHIEQGLGEVVRRLEHKVDTVVSLLDQDAFELLEARLASGVVGLEARLAALEQSQQLAQPSAAPAADSSRLLLERVAAVEAAMAEQGRAVADLLAALHTQGPAAVHQAAAAGVPAVPSQEPVPAAAPSSVPQAAAEEAAPHQEQGAQAASRPPAPQLLHQRKSALVKRSVLSNPGRSATATAAASPRAALPRLTSTHAAGTAQQIAMATAREQLAKQSARGHEDADADTPAWVTMMQVLGWTALVLLSLAAVAAGAVAVLVKEGRLSESDLESFLFK